jgi:hypothetical protein
VRVSNSNERAPRGVFLRRKPKETKILGILDITGILESMI